MLDFLRRYAPLLAFGLFACGDDDTRVPVEIRWLAPERMIACDPPMARRWPRAGDTPPS